MIPDETAVPEILRRLAIAARRVRDQRTRWGSGMNPEVNFWVDVLWLAAGVDAYPPSEGADQ